jgi:glyoxylase-like metal-dependent hydrolase (beta-lactamase superfamily II)
VIVAGERVQISPLVTRVTAPNPGMMTGAGTNAYLIGTKNFAIIDPGPNDDRHVGALIEAAAGRLRWILCTHTHRDHSPGAARLRDATGAQVLGMRCHTDDGRQDETFRPDRTLVGGDVVDGGEFSLRAVHTPGHASNHLCYLLEGERLLFSGDHIMQGSTVVISPPDGDMAAYLESLNALLALDIRCIAPGHGELIERPHDEVRRLVAHRLMRERKVVEAFALKNPATLDELVPIVYSDTSPRLHPVARRSLHAHLLKLVADGRVVATDAGWLLRIEDRGLRIED